MNNTPITENQKIVLQLIMENPVNGEGWYQISNSFWEHVLKQNHPDLTELDHENQRVRLTPEGITVMKYLP